MIDRTHQLPIGQQCQLLKLARSTAYYQPRLVSETALTLMRRIDELQLSLVLVHASENHRFGESVRKVIEQELAGKVVRAVEDEIAALQ